MPKHTKDTSNLTAMRRDREPSVAILGEDVVENPLGARILGARRLGKNPRPELVLFREIRLDDEFREEVLDVSLAVAAIAGVSGDSFAEEFLDNRDEGGGTWEVDVGECKVGCTEAASHWRCVVRLRVGDVFGCNLSFPVSVGDLGLANTAFCQVCVCPEGGTIAV